jgi:hypothetical protein
MRTRAKRLRRTLDVSDCHPSTKWSETLVRDFYCARSSIKKFGWSDLEIASAGPTSDGRPSCLIAERSRGSSSDGIVIHHVRLTGEARRNELSESRISLLAASLID